MMTRTGNTKKQAKKRGTTKYSMGSTPMARVAWIWSCVFIVPNSAVIPAPAFPEKINAVNTGLISRSRERATRRAINSLAPKRCKVINPCKPSTVPVANEVSITIMIDCTPCSYIWFKTSFQRTRPRRIKEKMSPKKKMASPMLRRCPKKLL